MSHRHHRRSKRSVLRTPRVCFAYAVSWAGLFLALCCFGASAQAQQTLNFQEGVGGYAGTEDLHLAIPANFTGTGHQASQHLTDPDSPIFVWDFEGVTGEGSVRRGSQSTRLGQSDQIALVRFRDVFGDGTDQIPPGAQIVSAFLYLEPLNATPIGFLADRKPGDPASLHEVLIDWDESVRWEDFGAVSGADIGSDFSNEIVASTGVADVTLAIDVTSSLSKWSQDPSANRGWLFMPNGTQDIISVSGSALGTVTKVTVDLAFTSLQRGEIVATLRRGDYTSVLINRIAAACAFQFGSAADNLSVTLDDDAATDIHDTSTGIGTYRPDGECTAFVFPLCPTPSTGLCGGPADDDWILQVWDEYRNGGPTLDSWSITLFDGVGQETYDGSSGVAIPARDKGSGFSATMASSENEVPENRPRLEVVFVETPVFTPTSLSALPMAGAQSVTVRIPDGANASADVTVTVVSDDANVVTVPGSPLLFAMGGPRSQALQLSIGQGGSALLTATNDASLGVATLPVEVATTGIGVAPDSLFRAASATDETLSVSIPVGSNATANVNLTVSTDNVGVVDIDGAVAGSLGLHFAAGTATSQDITLQFGAAAGLATLTASDDAMQLASSAAAVVTSLEAPVEYDVTAEPFIQLGNAALGAVTDQFVVAWQTTVRARAGANADRFTAEYRLAGTTPWTPVALATPVPHGSSSREHQYVEIVNLAFDAEYEYRVIHLRNEVQLAEYLGSVPTRKTDSVRFTAFGNAGQAVDSQFMMSAVMLGLTPDFHLAMGDNVYLNGEYEHYVPRVVDPYRELLRTKPIYYAMGNHDAFWDGGFGAQSFFFVPENGPPAISSEFNYSFDYGPVHFVSVNSGSGLGGDSFELETAPWLAADLAASNKPWKIVFTHEAPITRDPNPNERKETIKVRDFLFKPAVENGADLFLSGAVHSQQRYLPITKVVPDEEYFEWSACEQGGGTMPLYAGTGSWFRGFGPVPPSFTPPLEFYEPGLGLILIDADANDLTISFIDELGVTKDGPITLSQCINPGDCECTCGNGVLDVPEDCDDGNGVSGDGCSSTCLVEETLGLIGTPVGGFFVDVTISGIVIQVPTTGSTIHDLIVAIANHINVDTALRDLGITAFSDGDTLVTSGTIDLVDITDPGVLVPEPSSGLLQAGALLSLIALAAKRRGRRGAA